MLLPLSIWCVCVFSFFFFVSEGVVWFVAEGTFMEYISSGNLENVVNVLTGPNFHILANLRSD